MLPQRRLHLRLAVSRFLLRLLHGQPGAPLRQRRLLLLQQGRLAALPPQQRGRLLLRQLGLTLPLRCRPAQLLRHCSVLRQAALQGHLLQPSRYSCCTGAVAFTADGHRALQAGAGELQVSAAQRAAARTRPHRLGSRAGQREPRLARIRCRRAAYCFRRRRCNGVSLWQGREAHHRVPALLQAAAGAVSSRWARFAGCLPLPGLQLCNVSQLLSQAAALLLQRVQQPQLGACPHEGGVERLQEGWGVGGHELQAREGREQQRASDAGVMRLGSQCGGQPAAPCHPAPPKPTGTAGGRPGCSSASDGGGRKSRVRSSLSPAVPNSGLTACSHKARGSAMQGKQPGEAVPQRRRPPQRSRGW